MTDFDFQNPQALWTGVPLAAVLLCLFAVGLRRNGHELKKQIVLSTLRVIGALLLLFLAAQPVTVSSDEEEAEKRNRIAVLFDESQSMSLLEGDQSRYHQALDLARDRLLPALQEADFRIDPYLFSEQANATTGPQLAQVEPDGPHTDLGNALARVLIDSERPPLAVIALTDGATTRQTSVDRASSLLIDQRVRFVGIGFGREQGARLLTLQNAVAPQRAAPDQSFRIAAQLKAGGSEEIPAFDLVLLRDGEFVQKKRVSAFQGNRTWEESFSVEENEEKLFRYTIQLLPPEASNLKILQTQSSVNVRITDERELRVLFVQGGLTWDYKFIRLALKDDPSIRFSGLSKSSTDAAFFENVENDDDLLEGFPDSIDRLNKFQIVVLSNLQPRDFTPNQQKLLTQFCSEFGGGVLMIGGAETFDSVWMGTELEQLLPVRFAPLAGRNRQQASFRLRLSESVRNHPVFQLEDGNDSAEAWNSLPTFDKYAEVDELKPGAQVWLESSLVRGGKNPPIMASQRFGSGVSSVLCLQTFWRWRLAKETNTAHFDRFWRQFFRYLSEGARDSINLQLVNQELQPNAPVRLLVERRTTSGAGPGAPSDYVLKVTDANQELISKQRLNLSPGRFEELQFQAREEGLYTATVIDFRGDVQASRSIDLQKTRDEMRQTSRDMEQLRQWASLSGGFALPEEETLDCETIVDRLKETDPTPRKLPPQSTPLGINKWMLILILGCICSEWILRKLWNLT